MSSGKKKGLGRGLSALFGDQSAEEKTIEKKEINKVSISDLSRNPYQPRQIFNEDKLEELTLSIKKNGIIQPIAVRPNKSVSGKYEIVAGERRWLAAQRAGLHEIPVNILDLSDVESLEVAIVENIQRDDLNPIEEARGFKKLSEEFKYDHESISKLMSKSRSHISNTLRLLTLPKDVIAMLEEGTLSSGQARPLIGLANASSIAEEVVANNYSARKVEYLTRNKKGNNKIKEKTVDLNILKTQEKIEKILGLKVNITNKKIILEKYPLYIKI
jgi:ParB family chromosome partitioning protein